MTTDFSNSVILPENLPAIEAAEFKQMEFHRVQHLKFSQSIFYRKLGVASLEIGNASGKITIPFIDVKIARDLYDYLLWYAETSSRFWM